MKLELRKFTKFVDKTFIEGGKEAKASWAKVMAQMANPLSGPIPATVTLDQMRNR